MFRSLFAIREKQRDLKEEKRIALLESQSDTWNQQIQGVLNQVSTFIASARSRFPVVNVFPWSRNFGYTQDYDSNPPSPRGCYLWISNGNASVNKVSDDVSNGLLQGYRYHPPGIRILEVSYSSNNIEAHFAFPIAVGPSLFSLSGKVTFQFFYRYVSHTGDLPDMPFLDDANSWTDGKWHFQRRVINATAEPYKAWWIFVPILPPNSSLTIEVACMQAIAGTPENIDKYVDPITAY
jgi:hypothetical protein